MGWAMLTLADLIKDMFLSYPVFSVLLSAIVIGACFLKVHLKERKLKAEKETARQAKIAAEQEEWEREREIWKKAKEEKKRQASMSAENEEFEKARERLKQATEAKSPRNSFAEDRTTLSHEEDTLAVGESEEYYQARRSWWELDEETSKKIHEEVELRNKQFSDAVEAIPKVDVLVSAPAPKQFLKDMPDYDYSNITAKTKLSSIFPLVALDVETTGLYPSDSEIIEVSAIKFDVGMVPVECFTTLCKPKKPIPPQASAINHITDDMVENCPSFRQIASALSDFISGCNLVGHNLEFDLRFIHVHGAKVPFEKKLYDTLELAQRTVKKSDIGNHKLVSLCSWYGIHNTDTHRSLSDCYATAEIFVKLILDKTSRNLKEETGA